MPSEPTQEVESSRMPLWQHLDELRKGLIRTLLYIGIGFILTYRFSDSIIAFMEKPLLNALPAGEKHLFYTGIADKFFVYLQASFFSAIVLIFPLLLYEVWKFISPGLYKTERKFIVPFLFSGTVALAVGLAFAYYVVLPFAYSFLISFGNPSDKAMITLDNYFSLTFRLMAVIGLIFETPVAIILLCRFGILSPQFLAKHRGHAFIISSIIAAILTPTPDAFTMMLVLGPLYLLFEIGIWGARLTQKKVEISG